MQQQRGIRCASTAPCSNSRALHVHEVGAWLAVGAVVASKYQDRPAHDVSFDVNQPLSPEPAHRDFNSVNLAWSTATGRDPALTGPFGAVARIRTDGRRSTLLGERNVFAAGAPLAERKVLYGRHPSVGATDLSYVTVRFRHAHKERGGGGIEQPQLPRGRRQRGRPQKAVRRRRGGGFGFCRSCGKLLLAKELMLGPSALAKQVKPVVAK